MKLEKEKINLDKKQESKTKKLLIAFIAFMWLFLWLSTVIVTFTMETETHTVRYTVTSTESREDGIYISLSDNNEYVDVSDVLGDLNEGEEIEFTTVQYIRGKEKTLINNAKVYSSTESKTSEMFRIAVLIIWSVYSAVITFVSSSVVLVILFNSVCRVLGIKRGSDISME